MPYIGNTIRAADDYRLIDDISSSFNGSTTSFALQVAGSAPVPFPKSPQQVLISVNGVIQEPDPSGSSGFNLVGTNIVFSSAPTNGHAFFGIIYATADYLNAGGNFPAGSLGAPSITFIGDENTGLYRKGGGSIGFVADATEIANTDSNGLTISSGNLILGDSSGANDDRIKLGASGDLEIYHDGSHSRIDETGTGNLMIQSNNAVFIKKGTAENIATFNADGNVELYHDNSKKFETNSAGIEVTGNMFIADGSSSSNKVTLGTGGDLNLYHDGSDSYIDNNTGNLNLRVATNELAIRATPNGSVNLYHNAVQKLNTASGGVEISGTCTATSFAGDGSNLTGISTDLVNDGSPQLGGDLQTNDNNIDFGDSSSANNDRAVFGADSDMQLYHTGSQGVLDNDTGALSINTTSNLEFNVQSIFRVLTKGGSENCIQGITDGAVELYHDNSKKFETSSSGVDITGGAVATANSAQFRAVESGGATVKIQCGGSEGYIGTQTNHKISFVTNAASAGNGGRKWEISGAGHFIPYADNAYDIGSTSMRVRNVYTADLHMSNEGSANDVDGTWGSYTIQEGAEDLFLINRRSGKKFKFNLTEVN